ncbi:hypothetical protein [Bernardetia sp. MNP-M8]|uniref:hypothetical protein n=1 Tax=Bernardetia sp. MNP-M8 TaxID=3127470 RepID=UPI0030D62DED
MGQITTLSNDSLLDNVKKGVTAAKLKAIHTLIDTEITNKTTEILRPVSVVGTSTSSILNVANPYPSNTLSKIAIYKQIYVNGVDTEIGYEEKIPTKITKNVALTNDSYKIEGLDDGKYHVVFNPAATFIPYTV